MRATLQTGHGACLVELRRHEEAEARLLQGYHGLRKTLGVGDGRTRKALRHLVALYDAWGRPEAAAEYRRLLGSPTATSPRE